MSYQADELMKLIQGLRAIRQEALDIRQETLDLEALDLNSLAGSCSACIALNESKGDL